MNSCITQMYLVKRIKKNELFPVPIGIASNIEMYAFDPHAPKIKYFQDENNTCVLIRMDSTLFAANEQVIEHAVVLQILSSLSF